MRDLGSLRLHFFYFIFFSFLFFSFYFYFRRFRVDYFSFPLFSFYFLDLGVIVFEQKMNAELNSFQITTWNV